MKVHLVKEIIHVFLRGQLSASSTDWYFPHAIVDHFHVTWAHLAELGLKETYNRALRSEISNRWWKRDHYRPKEIMLSLIEADPELAAIAWKDLAQPNASLEGRLSRFNYYCEQLLDLHRQTYLRDIETYHHQDAAMMSLYLAGLFPDTYTLYPGLDVFQQFCKAVGSPDIPKVDDLVRYMKVAGIVFNFLKQDDQYEALLSSRDQPIHKIQCLPFQISGEVITSFLPVSAVRLS
ncbi:MAG TPA: hypothetical protein VJ508_14320 [Saprospiraceae bacterium]|nr:hypothetical protein [Saprospiraceae bacterium]